MDKRFRGLIRKAALKAAPEVSDALVTTLCTQITTKREYEDIFEDAGTVEAFALRLGLPEAQRDLLFSMQAGKDIFVPNPFADSLLTILFVVECFFIVRTMLRQGILTYFICALFLTDAVISRVKFLSGYYGRMLSVWLASRGITDSDSLAGRIQLKKWQEQSWQLFVHIAFTAAALTIFAREPWYDRPETCWIPHPYQQVATYPLDLKIVYIAALSVWVYTCFIHRFVDERRRDYFVMFLHHIVTIALVGISWSAQYLRIGILVMYVHDVSDIFVDLLKMANYLRLEGRRGFFCSEIAYAACMVAWSYWRLYVYPVYVINSAIWDVFRLCVPKDRDPFVYIFPPDLPLHTELVSLLVVLIIMHVYWFHLLSMVGYRIITESTREASRQEYEGDSDAEEGEAVTSKAAANSKGSKPGHKITTGDAAASSRGHFSAGGGVNGSTDRKPEDATEPVSSSDSISSVNSSGSVDDNSSSRHSRRRHRSNVVGNGHST